MFMFLLSLLTSFSGGLFSLLPVRNKCVCAWFRNVRWKLTFYQRPINSMNRRTEKSSHKYFKVRYIFSQHCMFGLLHYLVQSLAQTAW